MARQLRQRQAAWRGEGSRGAKAAAASSSVAWRLRRRQAAWRGGCGGVARHLVGVLEQLVRHQLAMKCGGASGGRGMRDERDSACHIRSDPSVVPAAASSDALADACRYPHSVSDPCAAAAVTSSCWVWAERIPPRCEVPVWGRMRGESSLESPILRGMHHWLPQEDYERLGSPHPDGHRRLDLQGALLINAYACLVDIIILIQR